MTLSLAIIKTVARTDVTGIDGLPVSKHIEKSLVQETTTFSKASREDIPTLIEIGTATYPGIQQGIASLETRLSWLDKNPDIYYVVRKDSEIVGYTAIIPMKPEKIRKILASNHKKNHARRTIQGIDKRNTALR